MRVQETEPGPRHARARGVTCRSVCPALPCPCLRFCTLGLKLLLVAANLAAFGRGGAVVRGGGCADRCARCAGRRVGVSKAEDEAEPGPRHARAGGVACRSVSLLLLLLPNGLLPAALSRFSEGALQACAASSLGRLLGAGGLPSFAAGDVPIDAPDAPAGADAVTAKPKMKLDLDPEAVKPGAALIGEVPSMATGDLPIDAPGPGESRLTAATHVDNPYCSCRPTIPQGLQLQPLWTIPIAAVS